MPPPQLPKVPDGCERAQALRRAAEAVKERSKELRLDLLSRRHDGRVPVDPEVAAILRAKLCVKPPR